MCLAALRMFMNGVSLVLQCMFPARGVTKTYGNEQLFFRSIIRFAGIPLYVAVTMQSFADLDATEWRRPLIENVINLIRCCVILPILTCSLAHQWKYTGTDANPRTTPQGALDVKDEQPAVAPPAETDASKTVVITEL